MKLLLITLLMFVLSGCQGVPVKRNFPELPPALVTGCESLLLAQNNDSLSSMLSTVTANYTLYSECSIKVDTWRQWYMEQKKIFDSVK